MVSDESTANCCRQCGSICKNVFCSPICTTSYKKISNFNLWFEGGDSTVPNKRIRKYLEELYGYKCADCGISEWNSKPIVLEVEHINGDSSDSSPNNVCLLCPNCHSQTSTYKSKNVGNGRHSRRLRYQSGKSY